MKPLLLKLRSHREPVTTRSASDDTLGRGMDLALTMLVFLGGGWLLDRWLGTNPLFTIVLAVLAMVGGGLRLKYSYDESMRHHELKRTEAMQARSGGER
jgi:F0F1-type ATP synthase assembly protein I